MMENLDLRAVPSTFIQSIDRALIIQKILRDSVPLHLQEISARTSLSPSTCHRILQMLVYRDFATQLDDRRYTVGPAVTAPLPVSDDLDALQESARPRMDRLAEEVGETCHLMVRTGSTVRVLVSSPGSLEPRVGSRENAVLPAATTSGGLALLAQMPDEWLIRVFYLQQSGRSSPVTEHFPTAADFQRTMERIRRDGFAQVSGLTERGVDAFGIALRGAEAVAPVALSVAAPTVRAATLSSSVTREAILRCAAEIVERAPQAQAQSQAGEPPGTQAGIRTVPQPR
ncbi:MULTISPECIES: IclR family transcriptional regulator [Brevibacterium]|uniref:IclR family transcriptional regulator n=2 Tax=Brevibacterium casei TaxID=33889 RepID=K9AFD0_9MICO|nr:IclR family transcriptional regulator C-terminal domain-containing protein [Brevibacterium casei]EKU45973.1 IclR family transcriptional regulator [Brevibacterium casei S18]MCT2184717.1 helix-turn-helix domain-containing protein [Brevibacterium casei]QQT68067.1 helix-turn-helix domain-containing protein [Brevibacterium casei]